MTGWRRTLAVAVAAVAGLFVAAGLTTAASTLSNQSVGLSSEPLTAGGALAPAETVTPSPTARPTRSPAPRPTRTPRPRRTATPAPTRTAVPTVDDDDDSGHGGDDDDDDSSGRGRGRGRGRGGDD